MLQPGQTTRKTGGVPGGGYSLDLPLAGRRIADKARKGKPDGHEDANQADLAAIQLQPRAAATPRQPTRSNR